MDSTRRSNHEGSACEDGRAELERLRWPGEVFCPHCGFVGPCWRLSNQGAIDRKHHHERRGGRDGLWRCGFCRRQFTVTVGTIFEHTRLSCAAWIRAITLLCEPPTGGSSRSVQAALRITPQSTRALIRRVMEARNQQPLLGMWRAAVQAFWKDKAWRNPSEKLVLAELRHGLRKGFGPLPDTLWPLSPLEAIRALLRVSVRKQF